jgi:DNA-binding PadR family transcriptional regulator
MSSRHTSSEGESNGSGIHRNVHQLTGFQRDLLYVISGLDRPSGQDIKERLESRTGREITHGRLYPNLDVLVTNEFVEKGEIDRRTNYYAATDYGVDALRQYHEWGTEQLPE